MMVRNEYRNDKFEISTLKENPIKMRCVDIIAENELSNAVIRERYFIWVKGCSRDPGVMIFVV